MLISATCALRTVLSFDSYLHLLVVEATLISNSFAQCFLVNLFSVLAV